MFTARYPLSPYIKQTCFVFKGLIQDCFVLFKGPAADATDALQPEGLLCNPVVKRKMQMMSFFFHFNEAVVERN
jgi:hypothetical protein